MAQWQELHVVAIIIAASLLSACGSPTRAQVRLFPAGCNPPTPYTYAAPPTPAPPPTTRPGETSIPTPVLFTPEPAAPTARPSPTPSSRSEAVDQAVVQIWHYAEDGNCQMLASGLIVRADGAVLTVLNYEDPIDPLVVFAPDRGSWPATIVAVDPRTSATLLKIDGHDLPIAPLGDSSQLTQTQTVTVHGWEYPDDQTSLYRRQVSAIDLSNPFSQEHLTFNLEWRGDSDTIQWRSSQGGAVVDEQGRAVGLTATYYVHGPRIIGLGASAVTLNTALDLLASDVVQREWAMWPVTWQANSGTGHSMDECGTYCDMNAQVARAAQQALGYLGATIPIATPITNTWELAAGGQTLNLLYPRPIELHGSDQTVSARFVVIRWNENGTLPCVYWGTQPTQLDGAFSVNGDLTSLQNLIQP
jgi:S1-C subfamily serine protease